MSRRFALVEAEAYLALLAAQLGALKPTVHKSLYLGLDVVLEWRLKECITWEQCRAVIGRSL